jgi:uncharacterized protein (DUF983 family)
MSIIAAPVNTRFEKRSNVEEFSNKPLADMKTRGIIADCTQCGKTALRVKYTPDIYHCVACKHSFYKEKKNNATG